MDGVLLIDKEKGITSRDVVNKVCHILNTRKVGHCGTLDPIATGLMIVCVNKATKIVDVLTEHDKEYICTVKVGINTDTYDVTGNILEERYEKIDKDTLINTLNSFKGEYLQEVPIYSAIKVNGKKLYDYARNNETVELPKHLVKIYDIELLDNNEETFSFRVKVSKGTYIRSLVHDIGTKLNIPMSMQELRRTKINNLDIKDSIKVEDVSFDKLINIKDILNIKTVVVKDELLKKIKNGNSINDIYNEELILFTDSDSNNLAIYKKYDNILKAFKVF